MPDDVFDQLPLFQGLTPEQINRLRPLLTRCECHAGTVLFDQGEPAIHLYLLVSGEIAIHFKPEDGQDLLVTRVKPGGLVGWSAVIGRRLYTSAAVCTQFSTMLRMRGSDLQVFCEQDPKTGYLIVDRLADIVAERLQGTHPQIVALLELGLKNGVH